VKFIKNLLEVIVILIALYLLIFPFVPGVLFWLDNNLKSVSPLSKFDSDRELSQGNLLHEPVKNKLDSNSPEEKRNLLLIPTIGLKEEILEGPNENTLNLGVWRKPDSSTPGSEKGNVVLTGHRFGYLSAAQRVFYNLDKVKAGDSVIVFWNGTDYTYTVEQVFEVSPDSLFIEEQSDDRTLTIYTCTPLWTSERRLVVRAKINSQN
jgi:LPXTG-site transpeptidase (sortase) family protein